MASRNKSAGSKVVNARRVPASCKTGAADSPRYYISRHSHHLREAAYYCETVFKWKGETKGNEEKQVSPTPDYTPDEISSRHYRNEQRAAVFKLRSMNFSGESGND